jgi:hypothetical protein
METPSKNQTPCVVGFKYVDFEKEASVVITYNYNGVSFPVLVSGEEGPDEYDVENSIEGKLLFEMDDLTYGEETEEKSERIKEIQEELKKVVADACFSFMQNVAPEPLPEAHTLHDYLYPPSYKLQVRTDGANLKVFKNDDFHIPERHPPIPQSKLNGMDLGDDIPVFQSLQIPVGRRLQSFVFRVTIGGEEMILKLSINMFGRIAVDEELATYLKIRNARSENKLLVPKLKGEF